jgi:hypothetical protein
MEERIERRARIATFSVAFAAALIAFAMNRVQVHQHRDTDTTGSHVTTTIASLFEADLPVPTTTASIEGQAEVQFG